MNKLDLSPTPWGVATCIHAMGKGSCYVIIDAKMNEVCRLPDGTLDGQHDSNASVMKSAPEMFEFICGLVSACDYGTERLSYDFRVRAERIICEVYGVRYERDYSSAWVEDVLRRNSETQQTMEKNDGQHDD